MPSGTAASASTKNHLKYQHGHQRNFNSEIPQLHYLFVSYLHQDWTVEGELLSEIFQNHRELQVRAVRIRSEVSALLGSGIDDSGLDRIFFGKWRTGYEPDEDEGETWIDVLRRISDICDRHASRFGGK